MYLPKNWFQDWILSYYGIETDLETNPGTKKNMQHVLFSFSSTLSTFIAFSTLITQFESLVLYSPLVNQIFTSHLTTQPGYQINLRPVI